MLPKLLKIIPFGLATFAPMISAAVILDAGARTDLGITIYNQNLALVNDTRSVNIPKGQTQIDIEGISPQLNHASALLRGLADNVTLISQNFRAVTTPADLLATSVGTTVTLQGVNPVNGEQTREQAQIMSVNGGLIFKIDGEYQTDLAGRTIIYSELPDGVLSPTLNVLLDSESAFSGELALSYLSKGLSWQADYVVRMNDAQNAMQLSALATLNNNSGVDFEDAQIELAAGEVNQVEQAFHNIEAVAMAAPLARKAAVVSEVSGDIHFYELPGRSTIEDKSAKQVLIFERTDIPAAVHYVLEGQSYLYFSPNAPEQKQSVNRYIQFENSLDSNLGLAMPAGTIRIYHESSGADSKLRYMGEDRIGHTPVDAKIRLKTGLAFDLEATRIQRGYKRLPVQQPYRTHNEVKIETLLHNGKDDEVVIEVQEAFSGEWVIIEGPEPLASHARSATWNVSVPAHSTAQLQLTVRVKN